MLGPTAPIVSTLEPALYSFIGSVDRQRMYLWKKPFCRHQFIQLTHDCFFFYL